MKLIEMIIKIKIAMNHNNLMEIIILCWIKIKQKYLKIIFKKIIMITS